MVSSSNADEPTKFLVSKCHVVNWLVEITRNILLEVWFSIGRWLLARCRWGCRPKYIVLPIVLHLVMFLKKYLGRGRGSVPWRKQPIRLPETPWCLITKGVMIIFPSTIPPLISSPERMTYVLPLVFCLCDAVLLSFFCWPVSAKVCFEHKHLDTWKQKIHWCW